MMTLSGNGHGLGGLGAPLGAINHSFGLGAINHSYGAIGAHTHSYGLGAFAGMDWTKVALVAGGAVAAVYLWKRHKRGKRLFGFGRARRRFHY